MEYNVLHAFDIEELELMAADWIAEGWKPVTGFAVCLDNLGKFNYFQAFTKDKTITKGKG